MIRFILTCKRFTTTVQMLEGRTDEQKQQLVDKVTLAVSESTGAPVEKVSIIIEEMKKTNYAVGGKRASEL